MDYEGFGLEALG